MDTDRNIFKALFCHFPIDKVVDHLLKGNGEKDGQWFYDTLGQILHENDSTINLQEATAIVNVYKKCVAKICPSQITTPMAGVFKHLRHCAESFLLKKDGELFVNKDHLLGWNDVTKMTGEDLLVCTWKGMLGNDNLTTYAWPDVMICSGTVTKKISQNGLCDIHAHLGGSADPFIMNWLCLMNGGFMDDQQFKEDTKAFEYNPLRVWCVIAARIRVAMFRRFLLLQRNAFGDELKTSLQLVVGQNNNFLEERNCVKTLVEQHKKKAKQTMDTPCVDYAISEDCNDTCMESPYMVWYGERKLLCCFFKDYLTGSTEIKKIAQYVYLYCLIRNYFRNEIMMTKRHMGLAYFKEYDKKKNTFVGKELKKVVSKYAFQTSLRPNGSDGVELRINATDDDITMAKSGILNECVFIKREWLNENQKKNVTYLIHLSKSMYQKGRAHANSSTYIQQLLEQELMNNQLFTGVDSAGEEMLCRPEQLGHSYRYMFERGHRNFTYHVGEDFIDIAEGLRAIDEAVVFLNVRKGWRLGHCVAMGIDVADFYKRKKHKIHTMRQILLDNLAWIVKRSEELHLRVSKKFRNNISNKILNLYQSLGYKTDFSLDAYYNSIWLRSDIQGGIDDNERVAWDRSMKCQHQRCALARKDPKAIRIASDYIVEESIRIKGTETEIWKTDEEYEKLISQLQNKLMKMIKKLNVGIEACPTSNKMLCDIERYDNLPLLRFNHVLPWKDKGLQVSINTDDKGIFATSLLNEFSLMACALSKKNGWLWRQKLGEKMIFRYLNEASTRGFSMKFNWNRNEYENHKY